MNTLYLEIKMTKEQDNLDKILNTLDVKHQESIEYIKKIATKTDPVDYEEDFYTLAQWIIFTDKNPWSFMPVGWEGVKHSAQAFESFLATLHHAMVDDGDICFVKSKVGPQIVFACKWDILECHILKSKVVSESVLRFDPDFKLHQDSNWFLEEVEKSD